MTVIEFLKTKTIEEIAEEYAKEFINGGTLDKTPLLWIFSDNVANDVGCCPKDCEYYCDYDDYYETDICELEQDETCPYKINKKESLIKTFINSLNSQMPEGDA